jgi:hypothetical protein
LLPCSEVQYAFYDGQKHRPLTLKATSHYSNDGIIKHGPESAVENPFVAELRSPIPRVGDRDGQHHLPLRYPGTVTWESWLPYSNENGRA